MQVIRTSKAEGRGSEADGFFVLYVKDSSAPLGCLDGAMVVDPKLVLARACFLSFLVVPLEAPRHPQVFQLTEVTEGRRYLGDMQG